MRVYGLFLLIIIFLFFGCSSSSESEKKVVTLQPFENIDTFLLDSITNTLERLYDVKAYTLPIQSLPENAITTFKGKRYNASQLLEFLKSEKLDSVDFIMGITKQDICITKRDEEGNILSPENKYRDFGIFGLGYRPGPSCVISSNRLSRGSSHLLTERLQKVSAHELGHNLGLEHCTYSQKCIMRSAAEKLSTIDEESLALCKSCKEKLN